MTDQSVSQRKRTTILDAARAVFSRKGYAHAAVEDVAEEARIAKGTLYLYFKSKEEMYLAALENDLRVLAAESRREMEAAGNLREKLRVFLRIRLDYCESHEDFLRIYLAEYGSMFIKAPQSPYRQLLRENMRYLAKVMENAIRQGEIAPGPAGAMAAAFFDMARGLVERRLLGWKEFRAADEIELTTNLLLSGIGRRLTAVPNGRSRARPETRRPKRMKQSGG